MSNFKNLKTVFFLLSLVFFGLNLKAETVNITISAHGNHIKFDQTKIEVKFSKKLAFEFQNNASKNSGIVHNIIIAEKKDEAELIKLFQKLQYDSEAIRKSPLILAMSTDLPPLEKTTLEVDLEKPKELVYLCSMPGHSDMLDMKGYLSFK